MPIDLHRTVQGTSWSTHRHFSYSVQLLNLKVGPATLRKCWHFRQPADLNNFYAEFSTPSHYLRQIKFISQKRLFFLFLAQYICFLNTFIASMCLWRFYTHCSRFSAARSEFGEPVPKCLDHMPRETRACVAAILSTRSLQIPLERSWFALSIGLNFERKRATIGWQIVGEIPYFFPTSAIRKSVCKSRWKYNWKKLNFCWIYWYKFHC